jgi:hypothetical protein
MNNDESTHFVYIYIYICLCVCVQFPGLQPARGRGVERMSERERKLTENKRSESERARRIFIYIHLDYIFSIRYPKGYRERKKRQRDRQTEV